MNKEHHALLKDISSIEDPELRDYVERTAFNESYWAVTKSRSAWHFDYSRVETELESQSLFRIAGRIEADFELALSKAKPPLHGANEISPIMLPSEKEDLRKWGYSSWGTDVVEATGLLQKIGESLGLKHPDIKLNRQPPGSCKWSHIDSLVSYIRKGFVHSMEEFSLVERVFIMLTPWEPGHFISFGNSICQQWQAGDVIWFDWRHAPHATANAGHNPRSLLRITGIMTEESRWLKELDFHSISIKGGCNNEQ